MAQLTPYAGAAMVEASSRSDRPRGIAPRPPGSTAFRRLVETSPRSKRRRHGPLSSWPGSSGPSVAARAGGDGPDKPGHDAEGAPSIRLNQPAECSNVHAQEQEARLPESNRLETGGST